MTQVSEGGVFALRKYYVFERPGERLYVAPSGLVSMADSELSALTATRHTDIYTIYDQLADAFPGYVTRRLLGKDTTGLPIYHYAFLPELPENKTEHRFERLKLVMTSGLHGYQQLSSWALARFLEDVCYSPRRQQVLDFLRWTPSRPIWRSTCSAP